ncbi:MAG: 16S rRNA processing protein RimM, partial [Deltaproteobacteria bacterium]|nr:16S rRNA processing protein RimM [Deltaproteobacteria bacterium]
MLARIVGAHALRGEVRARFFGDGPATLLEIPRVWLAKEPEAADARAYRVEKAGTGRGGEVRLALEGVEGRNAADELRGLFVLADEADLPSLAEDEYYWHQLVGCQVEDTAGAPIGRVKEIWETGA